VLDQSFDQRKDSNKKLNLIFSQKKDTAPIIIDHCNKDLYEDGGFGTYNRQQETMMKADMLRQETNNTT